MNSRSTNLRYKTQQPYQNSPPKYRYSIMRGQPFNLPALSPPNSQKNQANNINNLRNNQNQNIDLSSRHINARQQQNKQQNSQQQKLTQSNIYLRPGWLKRNQVGWDAVKLSQYVINSLADNYKSNADMLEKFRSEAEQNRKKKRHAHSITQKQNKINQYAQNIDVNLPTLVPSRQYDNNPQSDNQYYTNTTNQNQSVYFAQQPQQYMFHNVGINTNKAYQISNMQKYLKLRQKYDKLKQKYSNVKQKKLKTQRYNKLLQQQSDIGSKFYNLHQLQDSLVDIQRQLQLNNAGLRNNLTEQLPQITNQHCHKECDAKANTTKSRMGISSRKYDAPQHNKQTLNDIEDEMYSHSSKISKKQQTCKPTVIYTPTLHSRSLTLPQQTRSFNKALFTKPKYYGAN